MVGERYDCQQSVFMNLLVVVLFLITVGCAVIAALTPVSRAKGYTRLAASLFCGPALMLHLLAQAFDEGEFLPGVIGLFVGVFLVWVGLRKHRRDPEGRTPPAQIL